jgi:molybdenum cofactor biosynthesis enzyme MoaA
MPAEYVTAERVDITGGEPFLNKKNLIDLIKGVKSTGITKTIEVATNGF